MKDFEVHTTAMFKLVREYAEHHKLMDQLSGLLIIREVGAGSDQDAEANTAAKPVCRMAIQGEDASVAIQTIHYAAQILTQELRSVAQQTLGTTPEA